MSERISVDEAAWLRFLSHWALVPPVALIGAVAAFQITTHRGSEAAQGSSVSGSAG